MIKGDALLKSTLLSIKPPKNYFLNIFFLHPLLQYLVDKKQFNDWMNLIERNSIINLPLIINDRSKEIK